MWHIFNDIFNNSTDEKFGRKITELQCKIDNFDGKVEEMKRTMVKDSGKISIFTTGFG